jgi:hypothetical protein
MTGTVLIVDDERTLARAIKAFLLESGYEAEVAPDAEQAIGLLETLRPDVMLGVRPTRNRAVTTEQRDGVTRITVKKRRPRYLVPPISWVIRPRLETRVEIEGLGIEILELCDGRRTVEQIVDEFAGLHALTFHEARVSVTTYQKALVQRGVVVLVSEREVES